MWTELTCRPLDSLALALGLAIVLLPIPRVVHGESWRRVSNEEPTLSRHKRYVVFPEGSTYTVGLCLLFTATTGNNIWTESLNWVVNYDLPNETRSDRYPLDGLLPRSLVQRRHRRDLYAKLELLIEASGTNGRACVLRTLCEAAQRFVPGGSMLEEMIKTVFTVPLSRVLSWEPPEHTEYTAARRAGVQGESCEHLYSSCPVSLLDLALHATQTKYSSADDEGSGAENKENGGGVEDGGESAGGA